MRRLLIPALVMAVLAFVGAGVTTILSVRGVQDERRDSIRRSCTDQNRRHDATLRELNRLELAQLEGRLAAANTPPAVISLRMSQALARAPQVQRTQIDQGRIYTVLLIDALAPKRDCAAAVHQSVGR